MGILQKIKDKLDKSRERKITKSKEKELDELLKNNSILVEVNITARMKDRERIAKETIWFEDNWLEQDTMKDWGSKETGELFQKMLDSPQFKEFKEKTKNQPILKPNDIVSVCGCGKDILLIDFEKEIKELQYLLGLLKEKIKKKKVKICKISIKYTFSPRNLTAEQARMVREIKTFKDLPIHPSEKTNKSYFVEMIETINTF